jgi:branched-chain amino acid transport system substrate-binding protein
MRKALWVMLLALLIGLGFAGPAAAEVGVTDTEIVIGSHQDLSGPLTGWGSQVKMGLEMRAKEINEAGGIHGRKIRLVIEDNGYDPKKAIMVTNKMISLDKVFAFVGNMGSPTAGATKPIISAKKIPQLFPLTAATLFYKPYDRYSFLGFTPYYDQARAIVKYFVTKKKYTKVGLMYQDDEMGFSMKSGVEDQLKAHNMQLVAAESYKRGDTDFSTQIAKLKKADVQIVILATVIRETVGALKEAKKLSWNVDMVGMSPAYNQQIIDLCTKAGFSADGYYASGQSPLIYPDSPLPTVRMYCQKFKNLYGKYPDQPSIAGYYALEFFAKVAQKVGKNLTRERWVDAANTYGVFKDEYFGGTEVHFTDKDHQGGYDAILAQCQNGRFVKLTNISYRK